MWSHVSWGPESEGWAGMVGTRGGKWSHLWDSSLDHLAFWFVEFFRLIILVHLCFNLHSGPLVETDTALQEKKLSLRVTH